ncbi:MAG: CDP-alcohol phosphatidyltransferase family protein [Acidobacteriota bacterium]|nr:MAG: CDP-alcohol phosphatidyltransferase family protein [Acidobacteriota bacterium]
MRSSFSRGQVVAAYLAHIYTASGLVWAALSAFAIVEGNYNAACLWMMVAMAVDSTDGFLARRAKVKEVAPRVDGRKLDDIIDYLNYTFLPIMLLGHSGWLPSPTLLWIAIPLVSSIFAFVDRGAKEEQGGFFLGFPSYWNVFVMYVVLWLHAYDGIPIVLLILFLSFLSVIPVRFVYPSHAPRFRLFFNGGAAVWILLLCYLLWASPGSGSEFLVWLSLLYPVFYVLLSIYLDVADRRSTPEKSSTIPPPKQ